MAVEKFIFELENEDLRPTIPQEEIDDIDIGVNKFVKLLTDEVAKEEKLFTVKRIIKVGSFYEKTKVGNPDEFDFLLELDGTYEVEKGCELHSHARTAYVKIVAPVCTNETELRSKKIIYPDGYLCGRHTYDLWKYLIIDVLQKACLYRIQCKMGYLTTNKSILLVIAGVGPNVEICLEWHGEYGEFTINIDLCICIPCTNEQLEIWQSELIPGLDFSAESRPVLVVPSFRPLPVCRTCSVRCRLYNSSCYEAYWKISMAPIEVDTMRNIPEPYKLSYRVLKWMEKGRMKDLQFITCVFPEEILSSYILKNAVLCCQANNRQNQPSSCLEQVLQYLLECADRECLPAYFMPKVNLWHARVSKDAPPRNVIVMLMDYLFKTLKNSSAESLNFSEVRSKILHDNLRELSSNSPSHETSDKA